MISCTDCSENPAKFSSVCFCAKTKVRAKYNVELFSEPTANLLRAGGDLHQSHVGKAFPLLQQVGGGDGGGGRGGRGLGGHC